VSRGTCVTCLLADSTYVVMFSGAEIAALVKSNRMGLRSFETSGSCYDFSNVTSRKNQMVWYVAVKNSQNYFVFRRSKVCRSPPFPSSLSSGFRVMTCTCTFVFMKSVLKQSLQTCGSLPWLRLTAQWDLYIREYSDTSSANEDNSFRNHIR
jgi:hypothetical protein